MLDLLDDFYESTVQTVKPWAAAPRSSVPSPKQSRWSAGELVSTSLSSQDGPEPVDADGPGHLENEDTERVPRS